MTLGLAVAKQVRVVHPVGWRGGVLRKTSAGSNQIQAVAASADGRFLDKPRMAR